MTRFDYWRCDECHKILENCECSNIQLMFTLIANYDTEWNKYKAHFCSQKCLLDFVKEKVKDHHDLPVITDEDRPIETGTLGSMMEEKEREK